ncbi:hypothetical protein [Salmonella phage SD-1_S14]|nr:hypothetical protein [Salmonella phage SD-1_S14]
MPSNFTDKNGGNMAGHSDKWSEQIVIKQVKVHVGHVTKELV